MAGEAWQGMAGPGKAGLGKPVVEGNFWIGMAWAAFFSLVFFYGPVAIIAYLLWWAV